MDDEFGPTAEWDWSEQGRKSEAKNDEMDDVSIPVCSSEENDV